MAFNISRYIKDTAKSATQKIVDRVVSNVVAGLPLNTKLLATSSAQSLFNVGASYDSVEAITALKTDNIISGASDEYFALAGKAVNRATGGSISDIRRSSAESLSTYLLQSNPKTKIDSKRNDSQHEILSVL